MSKKNIASDVLKTIKNKSGKSVSQRDIQKLASNVNKSTLSSEAQLRKLIKQVSNVAKVPVAESTVKDIIRAVKKSGMNGQQMEQMIKKLMR